MASLLDFFMQNQRMPSGRELLEERQRAQSLLSGSDAPRPEAPSIFNLRGGGASLSQLRGTARMMGQQGQRAPQQAPQPGQGQQPPRREQSDAAKRQSAAGMAQRIMAVRPDNDLPPSAERYIREVTEENVNSGPGKPGRGWLARLFVGEKVPGLTEGQNNSILKNSLITAGLAMLASSGRGHDSLTLGQALGGGILAARMQATETAGQLLDEQKRQKRLVSRYSVLSDSNMTELERWKEIRRRSMAEGDVDAAEAAQDVITDLKDRVAGEGERTFNAKHGVWVDESEGKVYAFDGETELEQMPAPEPDRVRPVERTRVLEDGTEVSFLADPFTGEAIQGSETITGRPEAAGSQQEVDPEQARVADTIDRELTNIRNIIGDDPDTEEIEGADRFGAFGTFGRFARWLPAEWEPSDLKQMRAASENILSLIVRQRSGAQATEAEVRRLESFAIPKPGDDEETIRTKLGRMQAVVDTYQQTGNANAAVDHYLQDGSAGGQSEQDVLDEVYGGGS